MGDVAGVVAMHVRQQNRVNTVHLVSGSSKHLGKMATASPEKVARTCVHQNTLAARVDQKGIDRGLTVIVDSCASISSVDLGLRAIVQQFGKGNRQRAIA